MLAAALAQSGKVRRLSQQLFELAALQTDHQVLHRERFRLDELVTDAVQKFDLAGGAPKVLLEGAPPGRLEFDGDLQLIERALTNLIDNAMRHAPGSSPVRVSIQRAGAQARILVEDAGPGLPDEMVARLEQGQSLRDPPLPRSGRCAGGWRQRWHRRPGAGHRPARGGAARRQPAAAAVAGRRHAALSRVATGVAQALDPRCAGAAPPLRRRAPLDLGRPLLARFHAQLPGAGPHVSVPMAARASSSGSVGWLACLTSGLPERPA